jgi:hypothetical protein
VGNHDGILRRIALPVHSLRLMRFPGGHGSVHQQYFLYRRIVGGAREAICEIAFLDE